jgi:hypothetical protein
VPVPEKVPGSIAPQSIGVSRWLLASAPGEFDQVAKQLDAQALAALDEVTARHTQARVRRAAPAAESRRRPAPEEEEVDLDKLAAQVGMSPRKLRVGSRARRARRRSTTSTPSVRAR